MFNQFLEFAKSLGTSLAAKGISATMEESTETGSHVHMHLYLHLGRRYRAVGALALAPLAFEGSQPHVQPNTASGKDFQGALRYGHFYVVVDKIGTLFNWTGYPPCRRYTVEGWRLDIFPSPARSLALPTLTSAPKSALDFSTAWSTLELQSATKRTGQLSEHVKLNAKLCVQH